MLLRRFSTTISRPAVAMVLSGCGVYDGSEIHEAVSALVALSKAGVPVKLYAPDKLQFHVVNHLTGEVTADKRNVLVEAARIARGAIAPLTALTASVAEHDAVLFPGGFGAAKNLCTFATEGAAMSVDVEVAAVLRAFHAAKKPIGLCCISPVLAAKLFPGARLTVGSETTSPEWPYAGTAAAITTMGGAHVMKDVKEVCVDTVNNIVTAPAYMKDAPISDIYDSVTAMVTTVLALRR